MNIRCPACETLFRVDPEKVPASGVRARCAHCKKTFRLDRSGASRLDAPQPALASTAANVDLPRPSPLAAPDRGFAPAALSGARSAAATQTEALTATSTTAPPPRRPSFLNQNPEARAQRIARALVSDIVAYNKEKLQASITAGTLRTDFREEIRKSWEEYVEQVGLELAKKAPFFRDALNNILAKGQKVF